MMSSILKHLKRVMAAEYSRDLSAKVHAGASRFARLGFKPGGRVGYALRRQLMDEKLQPKAALKNGERKYLVTDHVRLLPGTADEVAVAGCIFEQFLRQKSETAIARELAGILYGAALCSPEIGRSWCPVAKHARLHARRILCALCALGVRASAP